MNRMTFRATVAALGLLLAAGCGDGARESAADTGAAFAAAADALSARLGAPGAVPGASDPAVKAFEAETGNALTSLGTRSLPVSGFDSYDALCGKTVTIVASYINVGVEQAPEASRAALMNRNAAQFLDQMFTPLLFSAHCTAAHLSFIEGSLSAGDLSTKKDALRSIRDGAYGQASGLLEMAGSSDLDEARKRKIVNLLAADAPSFAIALGPDQRRQLAGLADRHRAAFPADVQGQADKIKAGLAQAPCGKLCSL